MDVAFLETYAVTEIVKSYYNAEMYPIEIKKSKEPSRPDKNFGVFQQFKMEVQTGIILCLSDELIPYNRESWYCPVSVL